MKIYDTVIIGSGAAGLTAAIYTARDGLKTAVLAGNTPGGQLTQTPDVENYPGFPEGISGSELMQRARTQAENFGAEILPVLARSADFSDLPYTIETTDNTVRGQSVIIASGASARWLGLESETKYRGKGVSACATCDGFFFQGEEVLVIGGSDAAAEEALFLTKFARRVRILHRRDDLRASNALKQRLKANDKIEILWNTELIEVLGDGEKVTGARVITHPDGHPKNKLNQEDQLIEEKELECAGIFIAIGHSPNTDFLESTAVKTDKRGYIIAENEVFTGVEGVFAAGDAADSRYQQAVTAAGTGCKAALEVERFLAGCRTYQSISPPLEGGD